MGEALFRRSGGVRHVIVEQQQELGGRLAEDVAWGQSRLGQTHRGLCKSAGSGGRSIACQNNLLRVLESTGMISLVSRQEVETSTLCCCFHKLYLLIVEPCAAMVTAPLETCQFLFEQVPHD